MSRIDLLAHDTQRAFLFLLILWQCNKMNNLSRYRELKGLSQRELADMLGVSQPTIQRAEAEAPTAKLGTYKRCADVLGVTLADIFSDRDAMEDRLLEAFRRIPRRKHDQLMAILEVAQDLSPEGAPETNQIDSR